MSSLFVAEFKLLSSRTSILLWGIVASAGIFVSRPSADAQDPTQHSAPRQSSLLQPMGIASDRPRSNPVHGITHDLRPIAAALEPIRTSADPDKSGSFFDHPTGEIHLGPRPVNLTQSLISDHALRELIGGVPVRNPISAPEEFGRPIESAPAPNADIEPGLKRDKLVQQVSFQDPAGLPKSEPPEKGSEQKPTSNKDETQPPSSAINQETTIADLELEIEQQKALINGNASIEESLKTSQLEILNKATASLQKAAKFQTFVDGQQEQLYEKELDRLRAAVDTPPKPANPDENQESKELQIKTEALQVELKKAEADFSSFKNQIIDREKRISEIPTLQAAASTRKTSLATTLKEIQTTPESGARRLQILLINARKIANQKELEALAIESKQKTKTRTLLTLERDFSIQRIDQLKTEIKSWRSAHQKQRSLEIDQQKQDAQRANKEAGNAAPALKILAQRNQELARIRGEITGKIEAIRSKLDAIQLKTEEFDTAVKNLKQKIETTRMTPSLGMLLIEKRNDLAQPIQSLVRIEAISEELQDIKLAALVLKENRALLSSPNTVVQEWLKDNVNFEMDKNEFESMAKKLIDTQIKYDSDLESDYRKYRGLLVEEENEHAIFIDKIKNFRTYVATNALWIQSANPISISDFKKTPGAIGAYCKPSQWKAIGIDLKNQCTEKPYQIAFVGLSLIGIFLAKQRLRVMYV